MKVKISLEAFNVKRINNSSLTHFLSLMTTFPLEFPIPHPLFHKKLFLPSISYLHPSLNVSSLQSKSQKKNSSHLSLSFIVVLSSQS